ncbi:MAG: hypothetical protein MCM46_15925 [Candidatus Manganitrophus sp. SB1]|nr:hypothetical protein [Candidatus Manganitrophus morganii]
MKGIFVFVPLVLIWVLVGSGFSQTAPVSGKQVDQKISPDQSLPSPNEVPGLGIERGSLSGKVTEIGPGKQSIEVETGSGKRRSYPIDPGIRFERLQKTLRDLKKGEMVKLELAILGGTEVITDIEKIG